MQNAPETGALPPPPEGITQAPAAPLEVARAERFMAATANPLASEAAVLILREGGSAIDAAIAALMVLNVVEPQSSGIGGGGFMLHFDAARSEIRGYDGRETAPAAAGPNLFLRPDGTPLEFWEAVVGGRAVGTPGLLAMLESAHRNHGALPWQRLFKPAIALAEQGFKVSPRLSALIARDEHLKKDPEARAYFFDANGKALAAGTLRDNPALARTFRIVSEKGARAFYEGELARAMIDKIANHPENPGLLTLSDLAGYRAKEREVLCTTYRANKVCGFPPPTSGGVTLLQILGMLETFSLPEMKPFSSDALHLVAEASRLAFADRGRFLADTDFVPVPTAELLDRSYLARRAALIDPAHTLEDVEPGLPFQYAQMPEQYDPPATTHLVVVDVEGNVVSVTATIESAFGARQMVEGFLLNNELTDFSFLPSQNGTPIANRVEAGKRPRSSTAPTLVFDGEGRFLLALGSAGGSRIIGYVAKALIATLDWGLDPQQAIAAPNVVARSAKVEIEEHLGDEELARRLVALGHEVALVEMTSGTQAIMRTKEGTLLGGVDPRREGYSAGD